MKKYAQIIDKELKTVAVGESDEPEAIEVYKDMGMTIMDVEKAYNDTWYLEGCAPAKPQSETIAEQVTEYKKKLQEIDEKSLRATRAIIVGIGTDEDKAFIAKLEEDAEELRQKIRELENA